MESERGAVALVTAIFLTGVLIAVGMITIDVGRVYSERGQLQNGADAAALAVAQSCAKDPTCDTDQADDYANDNANDGSADIVEVCGTLGSWLPACGAQIGSELKKCGDPAPGSAWADAPYVRVTTRTDGATGSVIKSLFGGPDKNITACARASAAGVRTAAATIAFTVGSCMWSQMTNDGAGPYPTAIVELDVDKNPCPGSNFNGNFGWLDGMRDGCSDVVVDAEGDWQDEEGVKEGLMDECEDLLDPFIASGQPIIVPIYSTFDESAGGYQMLGWAAFVVTAYHLHNSNPAATKCVNKAKACIFGRFTQAIVTDPIEIGGTDMGVTAIGLTG